MTEADLEVDLVVVGAGMAGLSTAGFAAEHGATVLVVDKAPDIGGSAVLSGTTLWTAPTMEAFDELCPQGNRELGRVLVERFPAALEWVRSTGVEFTGERSVVRLGRGYRFDVLSYLKHCRSTVERSGGWVLPGHAVHRLLVEGGRVVGVELAETDGPSRIASPAVVLATGGFQGDEELRRRHLAGGRPMLLRANPFSAGDGLRMAEAVGAGTVGDLSTFYGHCIAAPITSFEPGDFGRLALQYSAEGVVVNRAGERFVDESRGDHVTAQELVRQQDGRGLVVVDRRVLRSPSLGASRLLAGPDYIERSVEEVFGDPRRAGAHVATASDVDSLGDAVTRWGFDGPELARTVRRFNAEIALDATGTPGRRWNRVPVNEPPFWVVEVQPAVTFSQAGLSVDKQARVRRPDGEPCPGLYAAGADVGGIYNGGYAGGLALALVFGLQAAQGVLAAQGRSA
jgi:succinate dehydrogenase/fumarate reductase flavoprotein subunit